MKYHSAKSRTQNPYLRFGILILFLICIVYFWKPIQSTLYSFIETPIRAYTYTKNSLGSIPEFIAAYTSSHKELLETNQSLTRTIERLENELVKQESYNLQRQILGDEYVDEVTLVLYPMMQDKSSLYDSIILSKGYKDGIVEGMTVYIRGRQPVCTITTTHDRTSQCVLFSSDKVTTEGVTASSTVLTLQGNGGGSFIALVPRDTLINVGETVFLRSDQTMKLGTVVDVIKNEQATSWQVYVKGTYNPVESSLFYTHP